MQQWNNVLKWKRKILSDIIWRSFLKIMVIEIFTGGNSRGQPQDKIPIPFSWILSIIHKLHLILHIKAA